jgi:hypothetical protein
MECIRSTHVSVLRFALTDELQLGNNNRQSVAVSGALGRFLAGSEEVLSEGVHFKQPHSPAMRPRMRLVQVRRARYLVERFVPAAASLMGM